METALIVFSSSVSGSRLKNATNRAQIRNVRITQTPQFLKSNGCSYSLRVQMSDLDDILAIAGRNNIKFTAVYREGSDISGTPTYYKLGL